MRFVLFVLVAFWDVLSVFFESVLATMLVVKAGHICGSYMRRMSDRLVVHRSMYPYANKRKGQ